MSRRRARQREKLMVAVGSAEAGSWLKARTFLLLSSWTYLRPTRSSCCGIAYLRGRRAGESCGEHLRTVKLGHEKDSLMGSGVGMMTHKSGTNLDILYMSPRGCF